MKKKSVMIIANGCQENRLDAQLLINYFSDERKYEITESSSEADMFIVLGCLVTQHMENESIDLLQFLRKAYADKEVLLMGCIAQVRPEIHTNVSTDGFPLEEIRDLIGLKKTSRKHAAHFMNRNGEEIQNYIASRKLGVFENYLGLSQGVSSRIFPLVFNLASQYKQYIESRIASFGRNIYSIKISTGCRGKCSYCSIKIGRGSITSKSIAGVIDEFREGLDAGYRDFALIGTDIGDYGADIGTNLSSLLREITDIPGNFIIRLRNINPRMLISDFDSFLAVLDSGKIVYMLSPVQSGNDRILKLMKREYSVSDYMRCIGRISDVYPRIVLRTQ